jgi:hypothetical protein
MSGVRTLFGRPTVLLAYSEHCLWTNTNALIDFNRMLTGCGFSSVEPCRDRCSAIVSVFRLKV